MLVRAFLGESRRIALACGAGETPEQARVLRSIGVLRWLGGDNEAALADFREAKRIGAQVAIPSFFIRSSVQRKYMYLHSRRTASVAKWIR